MTINMAEKGWESFLAKGGAGGRVTVPIAVREKLGIGQGDLVKVRVLKEMRERETPRHREESP